MNVQPTIMAIQEKTQSMLKNTPNQFQSMVTNITTITTLMAISTERDNRFRKEVPNICKPVIYQFSLSAHLCRAPTLLRFYSDSFSDSYYYFIRSILILTPFYHSPYESFLSSFPTRAHIPISAPYDYFSYLRYYDTLLLCFRLLYSVLSPNFYLTNCKVLLRLQFVN